MNTNIFEGTIRGRMKPGHSVSMDEETRTRPIEEQMDLAAKTLYYLGMQALRILLRTTVSSPRSVQFFFAEDLAGEAFRKLSKYEKKLLKDKEWQTHFFLQLQEKNAVSFPVFGQIACKNRFFIETLLNESKTDSRRLLQMVCEAGGIPVPTFSKKDISIYEGISLKSPLENGSLVSESPKEMSPKKSESSEDRRTQKITNEQSSSNSNVLQNIEELLTASLTYQEKLAENLIYMRDRGDELHKKVRALSDRIEQLEAKVEAPVAIEMPELNSMSVSVNSIRSSVLTMKQDIDSTLMKGTEELGGTMVSIKNDLKKTIQNSMDENQMKELSKMKASVARITSEFEALRELILEESIGESK